MNVSINDTLLFTNLREVGVEAIFSLSSAKPGNGVEQLRDENLETYWQSDGTAPHLVSIQFNKKVSITQLCFYLDFNLDESYTAKKIAIRSGTSLHDLIDVTTIELHEPIGWVTINLPCPHGGNGPLHTHLLQLRIISMHQNGRFVCNNLTSMKVILI